MLLSMAYDANTIGGILTQDPCLNASFRRGVNRYENRSTISALALFLLANTLGLVRKSRKRRNTRQGYRRNHPRWHRRCRRVCGLKYEFADNGFRCEWSLRFLVP